MLHLVAPTAVDQGTGRAGVIQVFLHVLLLDVEHGEEAIVGIVRRLHAKHALAPVEGIAEAPRQAVGRHAVGHAHLLEDFHAAAGEHDGSAALRELQLGIADHAGHAMAGQFQRRDHGRRSGTGNDHGLAPVARMLRRKPRVVHPIRVVDGRTRRGAGLVHAGLLMCCTQCRQCPFSKYPQKGTTKKHQPWTSNPSSSRWLPTPSLRCTRFT